MDVGVKQYHHPARLWQAEDGRVECLVCGDPVIRDTGGVRHAGEHPAQVAPELADLPAFGDAIATVTAALRGLPGGASPDQLAQVAVSALYERGALRRRPGSRPDRGGDLVLFH